MVHEPEVAYRLVDFHRGDAVFGGWRAVRWLRARSRGFLGRTAVGVELARGGESAGEKSWLSEVWKAWLFSKSTTVKGLMKSVSVVE